MDELTRRNIAGYEGLIDEFHEKTKVLEPDQIKIWNAFQDLVKPGGKILDLACGPGRDAKIFTERGFDVLGLDLSQGMIDKARKIAPKAQFKVMNLLELSFQPSSFDGVWFNAGLLMIEKKHAPKILADLSKSIVPEGIIAISVKEGTGEGFEIDKRYNVDRYYAYYAEDEMKNLLDEAGFQLLKLYRPNLDSKYHTHPWMFYICKKPSPE